MLALNTGKSTHNLMDRKLPSLSRYHYNFYLNLFLSIKCMFVMIFLVILLPPIYFGIIFKILFFSFWLKYKIYSLGFTIIHFNHLTLFSFISVH